MKTFRELKKGQRIAIQDMAQTEYAVVREVKTNSVVIQWEDDNKYDVVALNTEIELVTELKPFVCGWFAFELKEDNVMIGKGEGMQFKYNFSKGIGYVNCVINKGIVGQLFNNLSKIGTLEHKLCKIYVTEWLSNDYKGRCTNYILKEDEITYHQRQLNV